MSLINESLDLAEAIDMFLEDIDAMTEETFHDEKGHFTKAPKIGGSRSVPSGKSEPGLRYINTRITKGRGGKPNTQSFTAVPCGRNAREVGGNIRCHDGQVFREVKSKLAPKSRKRPGSGSDRRRR